jgi:hypothetical protein
MYPGYSSVSSFLPSFTATCSCVNIQDLNIFATIICKLLM